MPSGTLTSTVQASRAILGNILLLLMLAVGSMLLPVTAQQPQPPPNAPAAGNSTNTLAPSKDEQPMDLLVILKVCTITSPGLSLRLHCIFSMSKIAC